MSAVTAATAPCTLTEISRCQLCGSTESLVWFAEPPFRVLRCAGCDFVWVTPRLQGEALAAVYGESYWKSAAPKQRGYADYARDEQLYLRTFRKRLRLVRRHVPAMGSGPIRVLDVGCAAGYFLRVMQEQGHDVRGVELSPAIAGVAIGHLGAERVHVGTLAAVQAAAPAGFAPGSFDLVTMWDVVEHVPDPQDLLRRARAMLKPDGVLILETQNVASLFARLLGRRWHHFKHEEHLYHFAPATLRELLAQGGFALTHETASYGGKHVSLGFIVERAARLHPLFSTLLSPLKLVRGAHLYVNLRDELVVVARPASTLA